MKISKPGLNRQKTSKHRSCFRPPVTFSYRQDKRLNILKQIKKKLNLLGRSENVIATVLVCFFQLLCLMERQKRPT